jgi:hypothetical protein
MIKVTHFMSSLTYPSHRHVNRSIIKAAVTDFAWIQQETSQQEKNG